MAAGVPGQGACGELWSHCISWADLTVPVGIGDAAARLDLGEGWPDPWRVSWKAGQRTESRSVGELARVPLAGADPIWAFSWRRGQRHRPGLEYLVSTGRHHGFESMEEARTLLALDFAGDRADVVSQPAEHPPEDALRRARHTRMGPGLRRLQLGAPARQARCRRRGVHRLRGQAPPAPPVPPHIRLDGTGSGIPRGCASARPSPCRRSPQSRRRRKRGVREAAQPECRQRPRPGARRTQQFPAIALPAQTQQPGLHRSRSWCH